MWDAMFCRYGKLWYYTYYNHKHSLSLDRSPEDAISEIQIYCSFANLNCRYFVTVSYSGILTTMTDQVQTWREALNMWYLVVVFPNLNFGCFVMQSYNAIHSQVTDKVHTWRKA